MVVGSMIYTWLLNPTSGPVAEIASWFNLTVPNWTTSENLVIFVICLITAWKVFGYHFINLYAAIAGIDQEVIESAKLEGVGSLRIFLDIVIPMSSAAGLYVFIMTIVTGLQYVYTPIQVVTQGGPNKASSNLIYESYHHAFVTFNTGYSSAYSIVTLLIFIVLLVVLLKSSKRSVYYAN
jgi:sn-glycerol 3-phosphate transport system permease protein